MAQGITSTDAATPSGTEPSEAVPRCNTGLVAAALHRFADLLNAGELDQRHGSFDPDQLRQEAAVLQRSGAPQAIADDCLSGDDLHELA